MTAFQKINRRRWSTWARMTLLALAAALVVVLVLPGVVASQATELHAEPVAIGHVGGDAAEDCSFAELQEGGAAFTDATAFTSNPARDEGTPLEVVGPLADWTVQVSSVTKTSFTWSLFDGVEEVEFATGLGAPGDGNVSHVSFCLSLNGNGGYTMAAVEVKGSKDTNHYFYVPEYSCDQGALVPFSPNYSVTCSGKDSFHALFSQIDTNDPPDGSADTIVLITFGEGVAFYVENLTFDAQAAADINDVIPFVLKYDDINQDGTAAVDVPQCLFNPDTAGGGAADGIVDVNEFLVDGVTPNPDYAGVALPFLEPAEPPAENDPGDPRHTTCYFSLSFVQLGNGDWAPSYGLLNEGDGWRTIY